MILIDHEIVTEEEYLERVIIVRDDMYDFGYRDKDYDLFGFLGVEPLDEYGEELPIDDFVDKVSEAFLDFLNVVDYENIDKRYIS